MDETKSIEAWAEQKATPDWLFAIAKAITPGWGVGREVTEADFDAVIHLSGNLQILPA
jgi:hypothetical protein